MRSPSNQLAWYQYQSARCLSFPSCRLIGCASDCVLHLSGMFKTVSKEVSTLMITVNARSHIKRVAQYAFVSPKINAI